MIFEMNDINHNRSEDSSQPLVLAETQAAVGVVQHLDEEELSSSSSLDAFSSMSPVIGFSLPTVDQDSTVVPSTTTTTTSASALNAFNTNKPAATTTGGVYEFVNPAYLSSTDFLPAVVAPNSKHRSREEPARHHTAATTAPSHRTNHHTSKSHHHHHHHANVNSSKIKATTGVLWPSSTTATAKPLKCICKNNEKHFKCFSCTQNYPISVRRSKDDEASTIAAATAVSAANQLSKQQKRAKERMEFEARFNNSNNNNNSMQQVVKSQHHNQQQQAAALTSQSYSESSSIESHTSSSLSSSSSSSDSNVYDATILKLKPSPIPISSTLIALLALTNPGNNKFRPPPNVNLAHHVNHQSHVDKK